MLLKYKTKVKEYNHKATLTTAKQNILQLLRNILSFFLEKKYCREVHRQYTPFCIILCVLYQTLWQMNNTIDYLMMLILNISKIVSLYSK